MGAETSCCRGPTVNVQTMGQEPELAKDADQYVCTEWSHVESLLAHLPPNVHAMLEDEAFQMRCHESFRDIVKRRKEDQSKDPNFLEGEELIEAVHCSVPDSFLRDRLHVNDLSKLMLAFDTDSDGRISESEFDLFCMWAVAMDVMGFFTGTTPFARIANEAATQNCSKLIIISEFLDPDHILGRCALPNTACAYFHPDGITLDEFSSQVEAAAHVRMGQGKLFESVALANHGPDENGFWNVCSDHPVNLNSVNTAWPRLMPVFQALADMVSGPTKLGHVDLLACSFAANQTGLNCLEMIEKNVNAKFSASSDATGNVASHGNWELERGGRNVAPIYFHEDKLKEFTKLMAPASGRRAPGSGRHQKNKCTSIEEVVPGNVCEGAGPCGRRDGALLNMQEKVALNDENGFVNGISLPKDPYAVASSGRKQHDDAEAMKISKHALEAAETDDAIRMRHDGQKATPKKKPPARRARMPK